MVGKLWRWRGCCPVRLHIFHVVAVVRLLHLIPSPFSAAAPPISYIPVPPLMVLSAFGNVLAIRLEQKEKSDLLEELMLLPENAVVRRINELVKRARSVKVHAYIIHYLRKQMPYMMGKQDKQVRCWFVLWAWRIFCRNERPVCGACGALCRVQHE